MDDDWLTRLVRPPHAYPSVTSLNEVVHWSNVAATIDAIAKSPSQRLLIMGEFQLGRGHSDYFVCNEFHKIGRASFLWFRPIDMEEAERPVDKSRARLPFVIHPSHAEMRYFGTIDEGGSWLAAVRCAPLPSAVGLHMLLAPIAERIDIAEDAPGNFPPGIVFRPL